MNWNKLLLLSSVALGMFAASTVMAQTRAHHATASRVQASASHARVAPAMAGRHFRDHDRDFDDRRFRRFNNFAFFGFGFPFYYPYGYYYPYPYYDYYPYGYYAPPVYQGSNGDVSLVVQVQRRLARSGYYHGAIDGVMGSGTRRAIRGYERDHGLPVDGRIDPTLLSTMGLA